MSTAADNSAPGRDGSEHDVTADPTSREEAIHADSAEQPNDDDDDDDAFLRAVAHASAEQPPSDRSTLVGTRIGRFELTGELGRGGMGVVYAARDVSLEREVAIKLLPDDLVGDEVRRKRFMREARAASAVDHPNVARVLEVGELEGRIYIVMERVVGKSLRALVKHSVIAPEEALRIAGEVAEALASAHGRGIVHRDLKPDNVMIEEDGTVKLLDFGLAKRVLLTDESEDTASAETETLLTREGRLLGTPGYMSPEQALGKPTDAKSDVFSFGVLLYEMLAGQPPFRGSTTMETVLAASRDEHVPLVRKSPRIGRPLSRFVDRCLEKAPDGRFADGAALVVALAEARAARPGAPRLPWALAAAAAVATLVGWLATRPDPVRLLAIGAPPVPALVGHVPATPEPTTNVSPSAASVSAATQSRGTSGREQPPQSRGRPASSQHAAKSPASSSSAAAKSLLDPLGDQK